MTDPTIPFNLSGLISLLTTWMFGLIPAGAALMVMYHAIMKAVSTDEHLAAQHGRSIKNVLMFAAIALGANGLVVLVKTFVIPVPLH